jgi:hypothetical protein
VKADFFSLALEFYCSLSLSGFLYLLLTPDIPKHCHKLSCTRLFPLLLFLILDALSCGMCVGVRGVRFRDDDGKAPTYRGAAGNRKSVAKIVCVCVCVCGRERSRRAPEAHSEVLYHDNQNGHFLCDVLLFIGFALNKHSG